MANLTHAQLVTPERILFAGDAEAVTLRADGGDTTFLANHADYIASVDICVVRIEAAESTVASDGRPPSETTSPDASPRAHSTTAEPTGDSTSLGEVRAAVHGGFVQVADNKVTVLAGIAELGSEVDVERARRALEAAEAAEAAATGGGDEAAVAEAAAAAARARVRLAAAGQEA